MNEIILPIKYPFVTSYPATSNAVAILMTNSNTIPWLYNGFIQLVSWDQGFIDYYDFFYRRCPFLNYLRIPKSIIFSKWENIHEFIIESISQGYYAYPIVKTSYISAYNHKTVGTLHDMFIYGYNLEKQIFYIADNFDSGKYSFNMCTFSELNHSIMNLSFEDDKFINSDGCIELLSLKEGGDVSLRPSVVKESIIDYLEARPTYKWHSNSIIWNNYKDQSSNFFGVEIYETLFRHLDYLVDDQLINPDIRWSHIIYEHKKIMLDRLQLLDELNVLHNSSTLLNEYSDLLRGFHISRNKLLKYGYTKNSELLKSLKKEYITIKNQDIKLMEKIINYLVT